MEEEERKKRKREKREIDPEIMEKHGRGRGGEIGEKGGEIKSESNAKEWETKDLGTKGGEGRGIDISSEKEMTQIGEGILEKP
jgi:hypothetical protein